MKRSLHRGIFFYPMEVGYISNKRIRLLLNDHGPTGYWVWSCIIHEAYRVEGYFHKADADDIDFIAVDSRQTPELVYRIIESCIKRGLFDERVFRKENVLTNDRMQINYIKATYDRRRKGTPTYFYQKHFLLTEKQLADIGEKNLQNVLFFESNIPVYSNITLSSAKQQSASEPALFSEESKQTDGNIGEIPRKNENENENENEKIYKVDAKASPFVGIKNGSEISNLAINSSRVVKQKKFSSAETELGHKMMVKWMDWFEQRNNGTRPKFGGIEGKAVKNIYKHFLTIGRKKGFDEEKMVYDFAFDEFSLILSKWENLSGNSYLYGSVDIKKISHNLNEIINFLNNGSSTNKNSNHQYNGKSTGANQLLDDLKKMGKGRV